MRQNDHQTSGYLRVAVLVDLPRTAQSGGHVKCWERLAAAAIDLPVDLTIYFSGSAGDETLAPNVRLRHLPPVFSTANLPFLPYVPDNTDLAPYHPRLARELRQYDVIHTTDGFFAFARTAARVSRPRGIPLVTSIHTDTVSYTRIFTRATIEKIFGNRGARGWLGRKINNEWKWPERQERGMHRKLSRHIENCRHVLVTRDEDQTLAEEIVGSTRVNALRLGIDKRVFGPHQRDREGVMHDYEIPPNRIIVLFVGRVDIGKNIYTLIAAMEQALAAGAPIHLIVAGEGPAMADVKNRLGTHASTPGFVDSTELARLYASVDVLALSSEVEIRSMAVIEALASGCPVLVSAKSGIAPLFHHTLAMRVVASGVDTWSRALQEFAGQPATQEAMRIAALTYSRDHLASWQDVLAQDLLPIWERAAAGLTSLSKDSA